jgi:hypothetical protein
VPPSVRLHAEERKRLLDHYRRDPDPAVRLRAHLLLLLDDGLPGATIATLLYSSSSTLRRWRRRLTCGGVAVVLGPPRGRRPRLARSGATLVGGGVLRLTPADFGLLRSRWSREAAAFVRWQQQGIRTSRATVHRWLRRAGQVWRRPRPVLGLRDPERAAKVQAWRPLLAGWPADEGAVFPDEGDIHTNPKSGARGMRRGPQAAVVTPGSNDQRYLAGSLNCRTGQLLTTAGPKRDGALFERHLDELRYRLRRYRVLPVICDNARFHDPRRCHRIQEYVAQGGHRIVLHFLPPYALEGNPIERVWWHLQDEIPRNHRGRDSAALLDVVFTWLEHRSPFAIATSMDDQEDAA